MKNFLTKFNFTRQCMELKGDDLHILPYRSYGTFEKISIAARVLAYKNMRPSIGDGAFRNAINMYRRFESDELPNCTLQIQIAGQNYVLQSDQEGYVKRDIWLSNPIMPIPKKQWFRSDWKLIAPAIKLPDGQAITAVGDIFIPNGNMEYGIISDIDDTILKTHVVSKAKMLYYTFFKNAFSRLAFLGTSPLYWAWQKGSTGNYNNPIFYVSNSPHNLYDLLCDFMSHNDLPKGPILLRDIVLPNAAQIIAYRTHKYDTILHILQTYPQLPFILVGDSGERDADIYTEIAQLFPNRIKAIYIRSVADDKRNLRVQKVLERCETLETMLFNNSLSALQHSAQQKWVQLRWAKALQDNLNYPRQKPIWEEWTDE